MSKKIYVYPESLRRVLRDNRDFQSDEDIEKIINFLLTSSEFTPRLLPPWLVILLKVIAYAIGLVLAGFATSSCCNLIF